MIKQGVYRFRSKILYRLLLGIITIFLILIFLYTGISILYILPINLLMQTLYMEYCYKKIGYLSYNNDGLVLATKKDNIAVNSSFPQLEFYISYKNIYLNSKKRWIYHFWNHYPFFSNDYVYALDKVVIDGKTYYFKFNTPSEFEQYKELVDTLLQDGYNIKINHIPPLYNYFSKD